MPASTLGDTLLSAVRNLWSDVHRLTKVTNHHGLEMEDLKRRVAALERDVRGSRISRGMHKAKSVRLESAVDEKDRKIADMKRILGMPDGEELRPN